MQFLLADTSLIVLTTISIVLGILILAAVIFAFVAKAIVAIRYMRFKHKKVSNGLTAEETTKALLEGMEMNDVKVVRCNFFTANWFGNSYSVYGKKIRLRRNIYKSVSLTATALATQKVAQALMHKNKDKKLKVRSSLQPFIILAPILFIPIVVLGVIVDGLMSLNGVGAFIGIIVAGLYYVLAFVATLFTLPVEKKANQTAVEILEVSNLVTEDEIKDIKLIYKTYMLSYIADFIVTLLYLLKYILDIVIKLSAKKK